MNRTQEVEGSNPSSSTNLARPTRGFSLLELMITVIVVGILAALTIPNLTRAIERAKVEDAQEILLALHQAERYYFLDHTVDGAGQFGTLAQLITGNYVTDPAPNANWTFTINATTYLVRAARVGTGQTIDIDGTFTGNPNPTFVFGGNHPRRD